MRNWKGSYQITANALSHLRKKKCEFSDFIYFNSDNVATVSIGADHSEDYWCEGDYDLLRKMTFYTLGENATKMTCRTFILKKKMIKFILKVNALLIMIGRNFRKEVEKQMQLCKIFTIS